jgi:hypothetical protein
VNAVRDWTAGQELSAITAVELCSRARLSDKVKRLLDVALNDRITGLGCLASGASPTGILSGSEQPSGHSDNVRVSETRRIWNGPFEERFMTAYSGRRFPSRKWLLASKLIVR